jgi:hypothetical protein
MTIDDTPVTGAYGILAEVAGGPPVAPAAREGGEIG